MNENTPQQLDPLGGITARAIVIVAGICAVVIALVMSIASWHEVLHGTLDPPDLGHEERLLVKDAAAIAEKLDWSNEPWRVLAEALKASTGKTGRELFHPLRLALTGRESGPEMAGLLASMGQARALERLTAAARR